MCDGGAINEDEIMRNDSSTDRWHAAKHGKTCLKCCHTSKSRATATARCNKALRLPRLLCDTRGGGPCKRVANSKHAVQARMCSGVERQNLESMYSCIAIT